MDRVIVGGVMDNEQSGERARLACETRIAARGIKFRIPHSELRNGLASPAGARRASVSNRGKFTPPRMLRADNFAGKISLTVNLQNSTLSIQ
jgi:hypothetical protein